MIIYVINQVKKREMLRKLRLYLPSVSHVYMSMGYLHHVGIGRIYRRVSDQL